MSSESINFFVQSKQTLLQIGLAESPNVIDDSFRKQLLFFFATNDIAFDLSYEFL